MSPVSIWILRGLMYLAAILLCPFRRAALFRKRSGRPSCRRSFHQGEVLPEVFADFRAAEERGEIGRVH